ncbi:MAG TPA: ion channel [Propionibacteriaceae bacterium]|nr:ion channel [Propionibacteriaceae bacterium]
MTRVERWDRRTDVPLILLAVAFLVAYAIPVIHPALDPGLLEVLDAVSWTVWVAFGVDFAIRIVLADDRRGYALRHWYDVALIALPLLRPLRLLRLVALFRVLDRSVGASLAGRALVYAVGAATFSVFMGALAVLDAERASDHANITNLGDALWWAVSTVATVGYGDFTPVTFEGRVVAVVLMLVGIGLVGTVTAAMAAWLMQHRARPAVADRESLRVE